MAVAPISQEYRYRISTNVRVETEKRGLAKNITYEAELWPDFEEDPGIFKGAGTYSGRVTYFDVNCQDGLELPNREVPVGGDLEANAFEVFGNLGYTMGTTDWRLRPISFGEIYARTEEELEMVAPLGTYSDLTGVKLEGDFTSTTEVIESQGDACDGMVTHAVTTTIHREVIPYALEARPMVSKRKYLGERVILDGSRSTPRKKIESYEWKLVPTGACPAGTPEVTLSGKSASVRLLCPMEVTLTVTANGKSHSATSTATLAKRPWKTETLEMGFAYLTNSTLQYPCLSCALGRNVCNEEYQQGGERSGHLIHRANGQVGWENEGYALKQIDDPNGPFHGWWYVAENRLRVHRMSLINADLLVSGPIYRTNTQACSAGGNACDIDTLIASIHAHENAHTTLMFDALAKEGVDPAPSLESLYAAPSDKDALVLRADVAISEAEQALTDATAEDRVKAILKQNPEFDRSGQVLLPVGDGSWETWFVPNFAELGEE